MDKHNGVSAIRIKNRYAALYAARLLPGQSVELPEAPYLHLFVARGTVTLADSPTVTSASPPEVASASAGTLTAGDAVRFTATGGQKITAGEPANVTAGEPAEVLVWEMHATIAV